MGNPHLRRRNSSPTPSPPARILSLARNKSRVISKPSCSNHHHHPCPSPPTKPVVRIIQIHNPVFVKTDAMNFPSLVQKLTGKKSRLLSSDIEDIAHLSDQSFPTRLPSVQNPRHVHGGGYDLFFQSCSNHLPYVESPPHSCSDDLSSGDLLSSSSFNHSSSNHSFSELDIWAGLTSDQVLPDITMLPPLSF